MCQGEETGQEKVQMIEEILPEGWITDLKEEIKEEALAEDLEETTLEEEKTEEEEALVEPKSAQEYSRMNPEEWISCKKRLLIQ